MKKLYAFTAKISLLLIFSVTLASAQMPALLDPLTQPKFINPLPLPGVLSPVSPGGTYYEVSMSQFEQQLGIYDAQGNPLTTTVWGYNGSYPGPTIEAWRNVPVSVKWKNELTDNGSMLPHLLEVDTSIHWAMPMNWPASGVPVVTHLHGGHVESASDGNPEAWFTPGFAQTGPYFTQEIYTYSNDQESSTIWYHDHALGITRLNVYAGLAGFYLIRDAWENNLNLPSGNYEVPIVIQDRMFTQDGALHYPSMHEESDIPDNSIMAEMFGDFILVNGKAWPVLDVEPRKYRFRFLNGSDSRFYKLYFSENIPFHQIGSDGGLLNAPVMLDQMILGNGERKDVIVDFSDPALWGKTIILQNNARAPFPRGETVNPNTTGQIMAFRVNIPLNGVDNSVIPTVLRAAPIVQYGTPDNTRQLLLFEGEDEYDRLKPMLGTSAHGPLDWDEPITENPALNSLEEWQIINFTEDAHPIHLHLVNFQVISTQKFNRHRYEPGNPSSLQLLGQPRPPSADEQGWKDTQIMYPGEVTTIRAHFDLEGLYVWHCHILSHEDHEMMRPFYVGTMTQRIASPGFEDKFNMKVQPNPVTAQSIIRLEITEAGIYNVEVFSPLGQGIQLMKERYLDKGNHDIALSDVINTLNSDGIYFLRINGMNKTGITKLLVN